VHATGQACFQFSKEGTCEVVETAKKPRVHDDPAVREVYANKLITASFEGGPLVITLGTTRLLPDRVDEPLRPGTIPDVFVTGRLAISPQVAMELVNSLQGLLAIASRPPVGMMPGQAPVMPMPPGKAN
jgi:hypothetical protein